MDASELEALMEGSVIQKLLEKIKKLENTKAHVAPELTEYHKELQEKIDQAEKEYYDLMPIHRF